MDIILSRIYEDRGTPGYRVLVDRIWPRGISKQQAALDTWCKELAPTTALRQWFGHQPEKWPEFKEKYKKELAGLKTEGKTLLQQAGHQPLVLLYGARDTEHTHALVLKEFLEHLNRN